MFASKKGILSNLNHICLQHVSLGVHLSRRPEMQQGPITRAPLDSEEPTTGCQHCQEEASSLLEVDANSNNASTLCRCCDSHPHQQLKPDIPLEKSTLEEVLYDYREEASSPSDPALSTLSVSSSISSCSEFTLEETPVSFYCREFLSDGIPSPEGQPDIVPLEDCLINANLPLLQQAQGGSTSEEKCSSSSHWEPEQPCFITTPKQQAENVYNGCLSSDNPGVILELPEEPPSTRNEEELDSNCNSLPFFHDQCRASFPTASQQLEITFKNAAQFRTTGDPKTLNTPSMIGPIRQVQSNEVGKTLENLSRSPLPVVLEQTEEWRPGDSKRNLTSFHELAQRRRRGAAVLPPQPAKKDRSDWLISFSPDTELPPVNELTSSVLFQRDHECVPLLTELGKPTAPNQKEVTTFMEMRFRSALNKQSTQSVKGQGPWEPPGDGKLLDQWDLQRPAMGRTESNMNTHLDSESTGPPDGDLLPSIRGPHHGHLDITPKRKSRQGLQTIAESHLGDGEVHGECDLREKATSTPQQKSLAPAADPWSRGKADGGDRHSKEGLLVAVSSSVDKIIFHFSRTRNIVQKAQLGDSRLSPEVGHLILNTLCPALYALVGNGLKPFQKDVIAGRRRTSPWTLVEASVKPGPTTRTLHGLYCRVCQLPQLSSSRKRFNAFVFGLLNTKLLDFWVSHLQENSGTLSALYLPGGFLSLAEGSFQPLFDELLLLIQPLSILTFHLDLLFEHHHLQVNLQLLQPAAGALLCQAQGPFPPTGQSCQKPATGQGREDARERTKDPAAKEEYGHAAQIISEPRRPAPNQAPTNVQCPNSQAGGPQNMMQQVLQWGGKLSQTLVGNEACPSGSVKPSISGVTCTEPTVEKVGVGNDVKATTWWGQLSQASQVYIAPSRENFPFTRWSKLWMSTAGNCPSSPANQGGKTSERESHMAMAPGGTLGTERFAQGSHQKKQSDNTQGSPKSKSENSNIHDREGSHQHTGGNPFSDAAFSLLDSSTKGKEDLEDLEPHNQGQLDSQEPRHRKPPSQETSGSQESADEETPGFQESETPGYQESLDNEALGSKELSDQGTPGSRESHDKKNHVPGLQQTLEKTSSWPIPQKSYTKGKRGTFAVASQSPSPHSGEDDSPSSGSGVWLGYLFGAQCSSSRGSPTDGQPNGVKSRRPSSWLPPSMNVLGFVRKGLSPEKTALPEEIRKKPEDAPKPLRTVRALCDHAGPSGSHLSFHKDDVMQLLATVDDDWIRCSHGGGHTGLVPVAYTSLIL